jgi:hypothetical protein
MRKLFFVVVAGGCLTLTGCTIGVPLWPLMLVEQPAASSTNSCPPLLTLPVADQQHAAR